MLATNSDEVAPLLRALAADLQRIAGALDDAEAARRLFADGNHWRARLDVTKG